MEYLKRVPASCSSNIAGAVIRKTFCAQLRRCSRSSDTAIVVGVEHEMKSVLVSELYKSETEKNFTEQEKRISLKKCFRAQTIYEKCQIAPNMGLFEFSNRVSDGHRMFNT